MTFKNIYIYLNAYCLETYKKNWMHWNLLAIFLFTVQCHHKDDIQHTEHTDIDIFFQNAQKHVYNRK